MVSQSQLSPTTVKVWEALVQLVDAGVYDPTYDQIGQVCRMLANIVGNHLALLRQAGYVKQQSYWHRGVRLAKRQVLEQ